MQNVVGDSCMVKIEQISAWFRLRSSLPKGKGRARNILHQVEITLKWRPQLIKLNNAFVLGIAQEHLFSMTIYFTPPRFKLLPIATLLKEVLFLNKPSTK